MNNIEHHGGKRPDYFALPKTEEEAILKRIKGDFRHRIVSISISEDGLDSIPEAMLEHNLSDFLKRLLQSQHPRARGGEDLPDLLDGEVEIARLSLLNSVHGEVTSLRALKNAATGLIHFRIVDEYGGVFDLPKSVTEQTLTAEEVIEFFVNASPSPVETSCEIGFRSDFYDDLNTVAERLGVKMNREEQ